MCIFSIYIEPRQSKFRNITYLHKWILWTTLEMCKTSLNSNDYISFWKIMTRSLDMTYSLWNLVSKLYRFMFIIMLEVEARQAVKWYPFTRNSVHCIICMILYLSWKMLLLYWNIHSVQVFHNKTCTICELFVLVHFFDKCGHIWSLPQCTKNSCAHCWMSTCGHDMRGNIWPTQQS